MAYLFSGDGGDSDSAVVPLVCLQPFPLLLFASVPVCFILSAALVMMMKVPAFCYWFGCLFYAGMSAEMKAMVMKILYVCCISFLSFSLCIISLLWVFCSVFFAFFLCFFWVNFSVFALFLGSFFRLWCAYVLCLGSSNYFRVSSLSHRVGSVFIV